MASDYLLINIGGANKTGFEFLVMNRLDRLSFHIDFVMSQLENSNFLRFSSDHKHGVVSFPLRMTHYHDQTGVDCNSEVNTEDQRGKPNIAFHFSLIFETGFWQYFVLLSRLPGKISL